MTVADIFDDSGYGPSRLVAENGARSFGRPVGTVRASGEIGMGFWKAEPGTYRHPGSPGGETFVVLEGEARLELPDGSIELRPGSTVTVPPATPSSMVVRTLLRKFAVSAG